MATARSRMPASKGLTRSTSERVGTGSDRPGDDDVVVMSVLSLE